ncbi:L-aspartate oxidase [Tautonia marina]|uniref:L-aspartate oxidase n=1 Tax=Tautonia marina TaxID=2653855 RepID=UPI001260ECF4|nr:L-aspartate oxidase [Tautonia marina]
MIDSLDLPRRYLIPFDPRDLPHHFTDVLVIGGGLAGLRTALGVDPSARVLVVTKDQIRESNSTYAQGGIASVLDPEDNFDDHVADTLAAGKGLCDRSVVETVVREAPGRIAELIDWGTAFDQIDGQVALGLEGGHSHARIVHALGDATGREVMRAVVAQAQSRPNVRIWQNSFTIDLLTFEGRCRGAIVWDRRRGPSLIWARATLLATGGAGQLYRESTNPPIATGDGHALAYRAGAELRDMEFIQFHPTVLYIAGSSRHLLTEAIRGEGAYLRDCNGHRFMPEYHPDAELAPRDDVSRAIVAQMAKTQHPCVFLDLSHLDPALVRRRFPSIDSLLHGFGLDITRDQIPIRPGAHYMIGGITVDLDGRTDVPGLWAAGEVTSSGLHGANRLASNSLLEGLVFGARAAEDINRSLNGSIPSLLEVPPIAVDRHDTPHEPLDLADIRNSLRAQMWRNVGITRDARGLDEAARQVAFWCRYVLDQSFDDPEGWVLQNMLTVAHLIIAGASLREESRGTHTRRDFPNPRTDWERPVSFRRPRLPEDSAPIDPALVS